MRKMVFYSDNHYKWNGNTWVNVETLPFSFSSGGITVRKNKIFLIGNAFGTTGLMHVWDGTKWLPQ